MSRPRWLLRLALPALVVFGASALSAQGVTTGAIAGTVTNQQGAAIAEAQVQIINSATGYSAGASTRDNGYFFVQGLEVGGEPVDVSAGAVPIGRSTTWSAPSPTTNR